MKLFVRRLGALLGSFRSDRRGNIMVMFALSLVPVTAMVGITLEFARASKERAELDSAADSAILATVSSNTAEVNEQDVATKLFKRHLNEDLKKRLISVNVTSRREANGRLVSLTYVSQSTNLFRGILPRSNLEIVNTVSAFAADPSYNDVTFVLDRSASMLLAASEHDREEMEELSEGAFRNNGDGGAEEACAFACHERVHKTLPNDDIKPWMTVVKPKKKRKNPPGQRTVSITLTELAHAYGVRLRIDVMNDAVKSILEHFKGAQQNLSVDPSTPRYTVTMVDFGDDWKFTRTGNSNIAGSASAIASGDHDATIAAMPQMDNGNVWEFTNFGVVFDGIDDLPNLQSSGDGLSASTRRKHLLIVSDGVRDHDEAGYAPRRQEAFDPAHCTVFKNRGINVIVLYTRYYPLPENWWYMTYIHPFFDTIATRMQSCASDGMFLTADNEAEMNAAFRNILQVLNGTKTRLAE